MSRFHLLNILSFLLFSSSSLSAQLVPDFRVNDDMTTRPQTNAKVDTDAEGNFVVVWEDGREGINITHIYAQIFEKNANPIGGNFKINSNDTIRNLSLTVRSDGTFAVCWVAGNTATFNRQRIKFRLFDRTGIPITQEIIVSDSLSDFQGDPVLGNDSLGGFVVAWEYLDKKIYFQRLDASGNKIGGNIKVTDYLFVHSQKNPAITVRSNGSFILTWIDDRISSTFGGNNIFMQMYDSVGNRIGMNSMVNDSADSRDTYPRTLISHSQNKFIVVFRHEDFTSNLNYTKYQNYDNKGNKLDSNITLPIISSSTPWGISSESDGRSVIAYVRQAGAGVLSYFQRLDTSGNILGTSYLLTQSGLQTRAFYNDVKLYDNKIISVWQDLRNGNEDIYCNIRSFSNPDSTVSINQISSEIPEEFVLYQNYPNPFNPTTTITFSISTTQYAILKVFDILGREVAVLVDEKLSAGSYNVSFDGSGLNSGVYFYKLESEKFVQTRRMVLVK